MSLPLGLYRCRDTICLATSKDIVNEHINRHHKHRASINKMPDGSVVLHNNKPYDIDELTRLAHKRAKALKIDIKNPFSIIVDDRFIK